MQEDKHNGDQSEEEKKESKEVRIGLDAMRQCVIGR